MCLEPSLPLQIYGPFYGLLRGWLYALPAPLSGPLISDCVCSTGNTKWRSDQEGGPGLPQGGRFPIKGPPRLSKQHSPHTSPSLIFVRWKHVNFELLFPAQWHCTVLSHFLTLAHSFCVYVLKTIILKLSILDVPSVSSQMFSCKWLGLLKTI